MSRRQPQRYPLWLYVLDQLILAVTALLAGWLVGKLCTKLEFGRFTLVMNLLQLQMVLQAAIVIHPFGARFYQYSADAQPEYSARVTSRQVWLSAVMSFCIAWLPAVAVAPEVLDAFTALLLAAASVPILFREFLRRRLLLEGRLESTLRLDVLVSVIQFGGLLVVHEVIGLNLSTVMMVLLGGHLIPVVAVGWRVILEGAVSPSKALETLREEWSLIGGLLLSSVILFVGLRAFPWLVELSLGTAAVANLGAAQLVVGCMNPIINGLGNEINPRFARTLAEEGPAALSRALWRTLGLQSLVLGILAAAIAALGPKLLELLFGNKFPDLGGLIAILSVNTFLYGLAAPVAMGLITLERPGALSASSMATAGFTLVGVPLFANAYGLMGAAVASTISTLLLFVCSLIVFNRVVVARIAALRTASD